LPRLDFTLNEDLDQPLLFETLAASLEMDRREQKSLIEALATMLSGALPDHVTVSRGGWMLSKEKPVEQMMVRFDDMHYQISKDKSGSAYSAKSMKIVRGITLKTADLELGECIEQIVREVTAQAEKNSRMRDALQKFIRG